MKMENRIVDVQGSPVEVADTKTRKHIRVTTPEVPPYHALTFTIETNVWDLPPEYLVKAFTKELSLEGNLEYWDREVLRVTPDGEDTYEIRLETVRRYLVHTPLLEYGYIEDLVDWLWAYADEEEFREV